MAQQAKKIAVILSGCGVFDGSEIHESVITLLSLDMAEAEAVCYAPNIPHRHVINHGTKEESKGEIRNVLTEAARIARGKIQDLSKAKVAELDGAVFPGGFGAVKNLSSFSVDGARCSVDKSVVKFIEGMHKAGKPMAFLCIAPAICAKVLGAKGVSVTIGNDTATAKVIEELGAKHVECKVNEIHVDKVNKIVSTPSYMYADASVSKVAEGINKCIQTLIKLTV